RQGLYRWLKQHRDQITLIFVTGRDLQFIRQLVSLGDAPRPDYVIGDVGTTIAGGHYLVPLPELEVDIASRWQNAGPRMRKLLAHEPGIREQNTPFRYRLSYYYDPERLQRSTLDKIEAAGFDWLLSADTFLDVLPRGVSKGPTLLRLAEHLDLPRERILTAGDTLNDLSLFETGLPGVAVGNAEPALRERVAGMPNVYLSTLPGAAGILEAIARHPAL
ncbi:MAG: HAD family hydrolase, partial [Perlucidibaca sp.]